MKSKQRKQSKLNKLKIEIPKFFVNYVIVDFFNIFIISFDKNVLCLLL